MNTGRISEKNKKDIFRLSSIAYLALMICIVSYGCGGGGGGGGVGSANSSSDGGSANSITECYGCHADNKIAKYADDPIFTKWRDSKHGNYEGTNKAGNPEYGDFTDSTCATCHDEREDGKLIRAFYNSTGDNYLGTVDRPMVGCESCHGTGDNHMGMGPIPYPNPGAAICGDCHDGENHIADFPEGGNIYTGYNSSPHKNSINADVYAAGSAADVQPLCSKCHTDEGARTYKDYTAEYSAQDARFAGDSDVADANAVKCNTCHNAHDSDKLLLEASGGESAEYRTCTNCHQNTADAYHGNNNPDSTDTSLTVYDTHGDDSTTAAIEGYNGIDPSNDRVCRDCHNPHDADTSINNDWADSAHGGHILDTIDAGTGRASVTEKPWAEYKFSGSDRLACQRCHTATGFMNLAISPSDYNPVNNDFSHLSGEQREMLYCWACHTDSVGALRKPESYVSPRYLAGTASVTNGSAAITGTSASWSTSNIPIGSLFQVEGDAATYIVQAVNSGTQQITLSTVYAGATAAGVNYYATPYIVPSGRSVDTGDTGSSICASCHSGRQTGDFIKNYPVAIAGKNFGSFNSHYLADGGIMFRTIGYEYAGLDYSNDVSYLHPTIGTSGGDAGSEGPCVACHMKSEESHSFEVVEGDLGSVTDIKAYTDVCSACHADKTALISTLNTRDTQYNAALAALNTQLNSKGIYWCASYPYFKTAAACGGAFYTAWANKNTLGAAFNYNLLLNVPAAYVHNREYTRRLIYDSIDFLDDGLQNNSVEATLGGSGDAYDYLNGTR